MRQSPMGLNPSPDHSKAECSKVRCSKEGHSKASCFELKAERVPPVPSREALEDRSEVASDGGIPRPRLF